MLLNNAPVRLTALASAVGAAVVLAGAAPAHADRAAKNWAAQGAVVGIRGVDVSQWQHGYPKPLSFGKLRKAGARFVIIKASDGAARGDGPARKWWAKDRPAAHRARLVVGSYHYARPTGKVSALLTDAAGEAAQAASRTGRYRHGYLPTALDLETAPANLTPAQLTTWAETWLATYRSLTGRTPFLYSYRYFINTRLLPTPTLTSYPLWLAHYGVKQGAAPAPVTGWPEAAPVMWQFSSSGRLAGSGSRSIDLDLFRGTGDELRKRAGMSVSAARKFGLL